MKMCKFFVSICCRKFYNEILTGRVAGNSDFRDDFGDCEVKRKKYQKICSKKPRKKQQK